MKKRIWRVSEIINNNYTIYDLSKLDEKIDLNEKFYRLKKGNYNQEEYKYLISKNCEFFISTGVVSRNYLDYLKNQF